MKRPHILAFLFVAYFASIIGSAILPDFFFVKVVMVLLALTLIGVQIRWLDQDMKETEQRIVLRAWGRHLHKKR